MMGAGRSFFPSRGFRNSGRGCGRGGTRACSRVNGDGFSTCGCAGRGARGRVNSYGISTCRRAR
jgi:hypothetical protein